MADLIMTSTDGSVSVDVNAGLSGLHKITLTIGGQSFILSKQQLIDIAAPALAAWVKGQSNAPSGSSA